MVETQCKLEEEEKRGRLVLLILPPSVWAAWYITRLLVKLTLKGVVVSFLFSNCQLRHGLKPHLSRLSFAWPQYHMLQPSAPSLGQPPGHVSVATRHKASQHTHIVTTMQRVQNRTLLNMSHHPRHYMRVRAAGTRPAAHREYNSGLSLAASGYKGSHHDA